MSIHIKFNFEHKFHKADNAKHASKLNESARQLMSGAEDQMR